MLSAGVMVVYTTVVAGVGAALDPEAPAWLLVATTGGLAVVLEPVRRRFAISSIGPCTATVTIRWPWS